MTLCRVWSTESYWNIGFRPQWNTVSQDLPLWTRVRESPRCSSNPGFSFLESNRRCDQDLSKVSAVLASEYGDSSGAHSLDTWESWSGSNDLQANGIMKPIDFEASRAQILRQLKLQHPKREDRLYYRLPQPPWLPYLHEPRP